MKLHPSPQIGTSDTPHSSSAPTYYPKRIVVELQNNHLATPGSLALDTSTRQDLEAPDPAPLAGIEIHVICIYPTVHAGKLARQWIETALKNTFSTGSSIIEYFNYAVLTHGGISWPHVIQRMHPDIILMVGDGSSQLDGDLRHSLRELVTHSCNGSKPLVIFRDLEPEPTINTKTLLDYVSVLTRKNHCELNAMDGNGSPISYFRPPHQLLKSRRNHE